MSIQFGNFGGVQELFEVFSPILKSFQHPKRRLIMVSGTKTTRFDISGKGLSSRSNWGWGTWNGGAIALPVRAEPPQTLGKISGTGTQTQLNA